MDQRDSVNADPDVLTGSQGRCQRLRNQSGFWLLGLCNNFGYVVMLSAAHDILKQQESQNVTVPTPGLLHSHSGNNSSSNRYDCNPVSTAAVLLADILPTLLIKLTAPFIIHKMPYGFRILVCVATAMISFLVVSFSSTVWMSILGVIFASVSSGLGELSFLSLTVYFSSNVLSGWGSGTGGAGVAGAVLYSAFTQAGLSPRVTLLIMLIIPAVMMISYFFLLDFSPSFTHWRSGSGLSSEGDFHERRPLIVDDNDEDCVQDEKGRRDNRNAFYLLTEDQHSRPLTFSDKLHILKGLLKFTVPLCVVYFAEYFINQGLLELLYFPDSSLSHAEQYRWYQTLYQIGVFISRTSLYCFKFRRVWVLSLLQCVNAVVLLISVYYQFWPSVWVVFAVVLYEGLLGGAAYVNVFYLIRVETGEHEREFAMAAASVGDSIGIALSAAPAIPIHNYFCSL
ncbi:battenin isoform X1 [Tachysurus fulvidraco]|uniref:battenin isoform X1 n=1 Tax=Tachysurus fulvidraco TaxID=1234273 RepID=UPI001FEE54A1|nr:battenin isoform X1 [Tachysurus fulvidraco]